MGSPVPERYRKQRNQIDCQCANAHHQIAVMTAPASAGSNTVSVAEDEAMRILLLMRNFLPAHEQSKNGEVGP